MKIVNISLLFFLNCNEYSKQEKCKTFYKESNLLGSGSCGVYILLESVNRRFLNDDISNYSLISCIAFTEARNKCSKKNGYIPYFGNEY